MLKSPSVLSLIVQLLGISSMIVLPIVNRLTNSLKLVRGGLPGAL